jgi:secondary thiamine-phosphate synthase enzyme
VVLTAPTESAEQSEEISVKAPKRYGAIDLTPQVRNAVARSGIVSGCCLIYVRHTTCSLLINEWEDGLLGDLAGLLDRMLPPASYYAHDDLEVRTQNLVTGMSEPANAPAHLAQMLLGATSQTIPVLGGALALGTWQRVILLELDQPKDRSVLIQVFGSV